MAFVPGIRNQLAEKLRESTAAVLPVSLLVFLLCFTVTPLPVDAFLAFLFASALLILGIALFNMGADLSLAPMGEYVGAKMTRSRNVLLICLLSFVVGVMITISEPDLQVLSRYVPSIDTQVLIWSVAAGVGAFLVVAVLQMLLHIRLVWMLLGCYLFAFLFAVIFVDPAFWSVAFDAGGVTTGPITVPFIMALGLGVAAIRRDGGGGDNCFGLIALCSVGPITAVLVLGMVCGTDAGEAAGFTEIALESSRELPGLFIRELPTYLREVAVAVLPIAAFFFILQLFGRQRLPRRHLLGVLFGLLYTTVGLVIFLVGANVGFMPIGHLIGGHMAGGGSLFRLLLIPVGMLAGFFALRAEPAVQVLTRQVESVTAGLISRRALQNTLSIGVAISVGLSMLRAMTGISVMVFLAPGYAVALALMFVVPDLFTSIAFDSGGVASGPMTSTFLLALAIGATEAVGGNVMTDAFGTVAMVAMTPILSIQVMGLIYMMRLRRARKAAPPAVRQQGEIIELDRAEAAAGEPAEDIIEF